MQRIIGRRCRCVKVDCSRLRRVGFDPRPVPSAGVCVESNALAAVRRSSRRGIRVQRGRWRVDRPPESASIARRLGPDTDTFRQHGRDAQPGSACTDRRSDTHSEPCHSHTSTNCACNRESITTTIPRSTVGGGVCGRPAGRVPVRGHAVPLRSIASRGIRPLRRAPVPPPCQWLRGGAIDQLDSAVIEWPCAMGVGDRRPYDDRQLHLDRHDRNPGRGPA